MDKTNYVVKNAIKKSLIKTIIFTITGFFGVLGIAVGVMYLAGVFESPVVYPSAISFVDENYEPSVIDEEGELLTTFTIRVAGDPEYITEDDIVLSVSDTMVIYLDSNNAKLNEDITVNIRINPNTNLPYGGSAQITVRAGGGIYGADTCNVFIDVPVQSIEVNTSKGTKALFVNETISIYEPTFYPSISKNPSYVSEGTSIVVKANKEYLYKLYYELEQPTSGGGTVYTWVDVDNTTYSSSLKVVTWANAAKTSIVALKSGRFKIVSYAYKTYEKQDKIVTSQTEAEKLAEMEVVDGNDENDIFTVSEVDLQSVSSINYPTANEKLNLEYKKEIKIYLQTAKSTSVLASENAFNLGIRINPNPDYELDYTHMYSKLANVYLTSNLVNEGNILDIVGVSVQMGDGTTRIYPLLDEIWQSESDYSKREYYFILRIKAKPSPFQISVNIENPNDEAIISKSVACIVSDVPTTTFVFDDESEVDYNNMDMNVNVNSDLSYMNLLIDTDDTNEIDLNDFIINTADAGKTPTYDYIRFYALVSTTESAFAGNLYDVSSVIDLGSSNESYEISGNRFGVEIIDGILIPKSFGSVVIYAVLKQTDYSGNPVLYSLTNTETYKSTYMTVNVTTELKSVRASVVNEDYTELEDAELKENYSYRLKLVPTENGIETDYKVLERVINNISIYCYDPDGEKDAQITIDGTPYYYLNESTNYGAYYVNITIPRTDSGDYADAVAIDIRYTQDGSTTTVGTVNAVFDIIDTAVKSLNIDVDSDDATSKTQFEYVAVVEGNDIVWKERYESGVGNWITNGTFDYTVNIVGENKSYDISSSNSTYISVVNVGGVQTLVFNKPTNGVYITITATSAENTAMSDSVQIKLTANSVDFDFEISNSQLSNPTNFSVQNGEIYNGGTLYSKEVYYGDEINLADYFEISYGGISVFSRSVLTDVVDFEFETATNNAVVKTGDQKGIISFVHNVASQEIITVNIVSKLGDVIKFRFVLKNNMNPIMDITKAYSNNTISDSVDKYQNRAVITEHNETEYLTFVYNEDSSFDFSTFVELQRVTGSAINEIRYAVTTGNGYLSINSRTGVLNYYNSGFDDALTAPIVATVLVREIAYLTEADREYGNYYIVFSKSFNILIVPDICVESEVRTVGGTRTVYLAEQYNLLNEASLVDEVYEVVIAESGDIEIPTSSVFTLKNFKGITKVGTTTYSVDTNTSFAYVNNGSFVLNRDIILASMDISVSISYFRNIEYTDSAIIHVTPYNELTIIGGNEIEMYVGQSTLIRTFLTVSNDISGDIGDLLTFRLNSTSFLTIQEANSFDNARLIANTFSNNASTTVSVYINNVYVGYSFVVKVAQDIGQFEVVYGSLDTETVIYQEEQITAIVVNSNDTITLADLFKCKKNNGTDILLSYSVSQVNGMTFAYVESGVLKFYQSALENNIFTVTANPNLTGVEPLAVYIKLVNSQEMTIAYPFENNEFADIDSSIYSGEGTVVGVSGYQEILAGDSQDLRTQINAINIIGEIEEDIFNNLIFNAQVYNYSAEEWQSSPYIAVNSGFVSIASALPNNMVGRVLVTSSGGLVGYYNILMVTSDSVNSDSNITISFTYPTGSPVANSAIAGNEFINNQTYECVNNSVEKTIKFFETDGINRFVALFGVRDVTSDFRIMLDSEIGGVSISDGNLVIGTDCAKGTIIPVRFYNGYQVFGDIYYIYVGDNIVINLLKNTYPSADYDMTIILDYSISDTFALSEYFAFHTINGGDLGSGYTINYSTMIDSNEQLTNALAIVNGSTGFIAYDEFSIYDDYEIVRLIATITNTTTGRTFSKYYRIKIVGQEYYYYNSGTPSETNTDRNSEDNRVEFIYNSAVGADNTFVIQSNSIDLLNLGQFEGATISDVVCVLFDDDGSDYVTLSNVDDVIGITVNNNSTLKDIEGKISITVNGKLTYFYYVIKPTILLTAIESSESNPIEVYSLTSTDIVTGLEGSIFSISKYNFSTNQYEAITFAESGLNIAIFNEAGSSSELAGSSGSVVNFGLVGTNTLIKIQLRFGISAFDESVAYVWIKIMPNISGVEVTNPIEEGQEQADVNSEVNRLEFTPQSNFDVYGLITSISLLDTDLTSIYLEGESLNLDAIINLLTIASDEYVDVVKGENVYLITLKTLYNSSVDIDSALEIKVGSVIIGYIYYHIDSSFIAEIPSEFMSVYSSDSNGIDLGLIGDCFVGNDGSVITGGTLSFVAIDNTDVYNIENGVLTPVSTLETDTVARVLVLYSVEQSVQTGGGVNNEGGPSDAEDVQTIVYTSVVEITIKVAKIELESKTNGIKYISTSNSTGVVFNVPNDSSDYRFNFNDFYIAKSAGSVVQNPTISEISASYNATTGATNIVFKVNGQEFCDSFVICSASEIAFHNTYTYEDNTDYNEVVAGNAIADLSAYVGVFVNKSTGNAILKKSGSVYDFSVVNGPTNISLTKNISNIYSLSTFFAIETQEIKIVVKMLDNSNNIYYGLVKFTIIPSVVINEIYNHTSQRVSVFKANIGIDMEDLYAINLKSAYCYDIVSSVALTRSVFVYNRDGNLVTGNPSPLTGSIFCASTSAEGYSFVIKTTFTFIRNNVPYIYSSYYFIKIEGVDYTFAQNSTLSQISQGENLTLAQLGQFEDMEGGIVCFSAIGGQYSFDTTIIEDVTTYKISTVSVLYNTTVKVLITYIYGGLTFYAIGEFILLPEYVIENAKNPVSNDYETEFELGNTVTSISVFNSKYINIGDSEKDLFTSLKVVYRNASNIILEEYTFFDEIADQSSICFTFNNLQTILNLKEGGSFSNGSSLTISLRFESNGQIKYVTYTIFLIDVIENSVVCSITPDLVQGEEYENFVSEFLYNKMLSINNVELSADNLSNYKIILSSSSPYITINDYKVTVGVSLSKKPANIKIIVNSASDQYIGYATIVCQLIVSDSQNSRTIKVNGADISAASWEYVKAESMVNGETIVNLDNVTVSDAVDTSYSWTTSVNAYYFDDTSVANNLVFDYTNGTSGNLSSLTISLNDSLRNSNLYIVIHYVLTFVSSGESVSFDYVIEINKSDEELLISDDATLDGNDIQDYTIKYLGIINSSIDTVKHFGFQLNNTIYTDITIETNNDIDVVISGNIVTFKPVYYEKTITLILTKTLANRTLKAVVYVWLQPSVDITYNTDDDSSYYKTSAELTVGDENNNSINFTGYETGIDLDANNITVFDMVSGSLVVNDGHYSMDSDVLTVLKGDVILVIGSDSPYPDYYVFKVFEYEPDYTTEIEIYLSNGLVNNTGDTFTISNDVNFATDVVVEINDETDTTTIISVNTENEYFDILINGRELTITPKATTDLSVSYIINFSLNIIVDSISITKNYTVNFYYSDFPLSNYEQNVVIDSANIAEYICLYDFSTDANFGNVSLGEFSYNDVFFEDNKLFVKMNYELNIDDVNSEVTYAYGFGDLMLDSAVYQIPVTYTYLNMSLVGELKFNITLSGATWTEPFEVYDVGENVIMNTDSTLDLNSLMVGYGYVSVNDVTILDPLGFVSLSENVVNVGNINNSDALNTDKVALIIECVKADESTEMYLLIVELLRNDEETDIVDYETIENTIIGNFVDYETSLSTVSLGLILSLNDRNNILSTYSFVENSPSLDLTIDNYLVHTVSYNGVITKSFFVYIRENVDSNINYYKVKITFNREEAIQTEENINYSIKSVTKIDNYVYTACKNMNINDLGGVDKNILKTKAGLPSTVFTITNKSFNNLTNCLEFTIVTYKNNQINNSINGTYFFTVYPKEFTYRNIYMGRISSNSYILFEQYDADNNLVADIDTVFFNGEAMIDGIEVSGVTVSYSSNTIVFDNALAETRIELGVLSTYGDITRFAIVSFIIPKSDVKLFASGESIGIEKITSTSTSLTPSFVSNGVTYSGVTYSGVTYSIELVDVVGEGISISEDKSTLKVSSSVSQIFSVKYTFTDSFGNVVTRYRMFEIVDESYAYTGSNVITLPANSNDVIIKNSRANTTVIIYGESTIEEILGITYDNSSSGYFSVTTDKKGIVIGAAPERNYMLKLFLNSGSTVMVSLSVVNKISFSYTAPELIELGYGDIIYFGINESGNRYSIGTFELLATLLTSGEISEYIMLNQYATNFKIESDSGLVTISNDMLTAGEVVNDTYIQIKATIYFGDEKYIGYFEILLKAAYEITNNFQNQIINVEVGDVLQISDLYNIYKNSIEVTDATSENIVIEVSNNQMEFNKEFQTLTIVEGSENGIFYFDIEFTKASITKTLTYIIQVADTVYTLEAKADIYSFHSGQSVDLDSLLPKVYDKNGTIIAFGEGDTVAYDFNGCKYSSEDDSPSYISEDENNVGKITFNDVIQDTQIEIIVTQTINGKNYISTLRFTILATVQMSVTIDKTFAQNGVEKVLAGTTFGYGSTLYNNWFNTSTSVASNDSSVESIEYRNSTNQIVEAIAGESNFAHCYSNLYAYITFKYTTNSGQIIRVTKCVYIEQNRFLNLLVTRLVSNNEVASDAGYDLSQVFTFQKRDGTFITYSPEELEVKVYKYDGTEIANAVTFGNNQIFVKYQPASTETISVVITDKETGNSITYRCIVGGTA